MKVFIDETKNRIFICSPKCGNTSIAKYLNVNLQYNYSNIDEKLNDKKYLKIIIIRDIFSRFISGFNEDLNNNECYNNIDINFDQYLDFLKYCYDNKIKNVNNLNVYYKDKDKDKDIWWGQCSNKKLPITTSTGIISGHIGSQKYFIGDIINKITDSNRIVISINDLGKYINNVVCNVKNITNNDFDNKTSLSIVKKSKMFINKEKLLTERNVKIISHIYNEDIEFLNYLNTKIISLSSNYSVKACAIKSAIKKYTFSNLQSQFFDWLVCDMKSINQILNNIINKINVEFKFDTTNIIYPNKINLTTIKFLNYNKFVSHHDIHKFDKNSINLITDKYHRRYNRLIDTLKQNKIIKFIRYSKDNNDLNEEEIFDFFKNLKIINSGLEPNLILVSDCENLYISDRLKNLKNFKYIKIPPNTENNYDLQVEIYKKILL